MTVQKKHPLSVLTTLLLVAVTCYLLARHSLQRTSPTYPPLPRTYDVIVVGGGLAGDLAALAAAEEGVDVLCLQSDGRTGSAPYPPLFWAAGTPQQVEAGVEYLPETMAMEIYAGGGERGSFAQILALSLESAAGLEWLENLCGEVFLLAGNNGLHKAQDSFLRDTTPKIRRLAAAKVLDYTADLLPVRLLKNEEKVTGLQVRTNAGEEEIYARAVILADGGYGGNKEMLAAYAQVTGVAARLDGGQQGAGLKLALEAGAQTVGLGRVVLHAVVPATGMHVNNEDVTNAFLFAAGGQLVENNAEIDLLLQQNRGLLFAVFSGESREERLPTATVADLDELASVLAAKPGSLAEVLPKLEFPCRAAAITLVAYLPGGLLVTEKYQVRGGSGPITGLYAAGEGTAGIQGDGSLPELYLTEAVIGALLAGRNAAAYARR
ncbi:MAG: FAD-binding protein [Firmicutes bacterium]|jgi:succinate dehydrogenase/fumarate reductase flavoprotein subunit|nr:FAD-binding protein [Bacillota bacterium]